jgi:hypothetical protein
MYEYSLNMRFGELVQWVLHKCYGPVIVGSSPIVCIAYSKDGVYTASQSYLHAHACHHTQARATMGRGLTQREAAATARINISQVGW